MKPAKKQQQQQQQQNMQVKFLKCENAKENLKGALPAGAARKCLK